MVLKKIIKKKLNTKIKDKKNISKSTIEKKTNKES